MLVNEISPRRRERFQSILSPRHDLSSGSKVAEARVWEEFRSLDALSINPCHWMLHGAHFPLPIFQLLGFILRFRLGLENQNLLVVLLGVQQLLCFLRRHRVRCDLLLFARLSFRFVL